MQQIQGILCACNAEELASRGKNRATIQDVVMTLCTDAARPRCHNRISFDDAPQNTLQAEASRVFLNCFRGCGGFQ
jgi:methionine synthase I (cobalamin-dependent)